MIPSNIHPTLFLSNDSNYILFKIAIYFAESGINVWLISPTVFDKIPENIIAPDKETLKLITFVYLKDYQSLIKHLNAIHLWHKVPRVLLIAGFEAYTNLWKENYDPLLSAIVSSSILDSASVCWKKTQQSIFPIASLKEAPDIYMDRFQVLHELYFPNLIRNGDKNGILDKIINYYSNK